MTMNIPFQGSKGIPALGKKAFIPKQKDLALKSYLDKAALISSGEVPAAPSMTYLHQPDGGLPTWDADDLGNASIGLCVLAAPAHHLMLVSKLAGSSITITREQVIGAYTKYTGFDPITGANDNGWVVRDMLDAGRKDGLYGHKILAYAAVDKSSPEEMEIATWLGCGTIGGYALPLTAQNQVDANGRQLWDVPVGGWNSKNGPGSWGGHCIHAHSTSVNRDGGNSWGEKTFWTSAWRNACQDECWLVIWDNWQFATGICPNGFALKDLIADAQARSAA